MCSPKQRIATLLQTSIEEMELIEKMSQPLNIPEDFGRDLNGVIILRACSMSIMYITENFIKIRNLTSEAFFAEYKTVPWKLVFGMRNILAHKYTDVDDKAIFTTIKTDLPILKETSKTILTDLHNGSLDKHFK